ncbi:MAG: hypothetical protein JNM22_05620 [Saprospiraceae bacterium]|nr:hypothetical protein [Saprospiraceae bacterium]
MVTRVILVLMCVVPFFVSGQALTTDTKDYQTAKKRLYVGTDTSLYYTSMSHIINSSSTYRQATDAKTVYDFVTGDRINIIAGTGISKTGTWPNITLANTGDLSATNELQDLSLSGQTLSLTDDASTVTLPVVGISAGTGISVSPSAGVYTITNTGDTNASDDITTATTLGGDLSGTLPNPTVVKIQGRSVANTAPSTGEILKWNGSAWAPGTDAGASMSGHTLKDDGVSMTARTGANFITTSQINAALTDDGAGDETEIRFTILGDAITATEIAAGAVGTSEISDNSVANADFRQSAGLSVVGNSTNATGNVADITAGSDKQVLRRNGTSLGFGAIDLASSAAVTGNLSVNNLNSGTSASSSTFWRGDGTWATPSGLLPSGTSGQTLRHNGSAWVANSILYNDGTNIGVNTSSPGERLEIGVSGGIKFPINYSALSDRTFYYTNKDIIKFGPTKTIEKATINTLSISQNTYWNAGDYFDLCSISAFEFGSARIVVESSGNAQGSFREYNIPIGYSNDNWNSYGYSGVTNNVWLLLTEEGTYGRSWGDNFTSQWKLAIRANNSTVEFRLMAVTSGEIRGAPFDYGNATVTVKFYFSDNMTNLSNPVVLSTSGTGMSVPTSTVPSVLSSTMGRSIFRNPVTIGESYKAITSPPTNGLIVEGNVGIGNSAPTQKLHVSGNARLTGALYDGTNSAGSSGNILTSTGGATAWSSVASILSAGNALTTSTSFSGDVSGVYNNIQLGSNVVANADFRQSSALSVVGNSTNATANVADIAAASDNQVLRRSGTSLGFGAINLASSAAVTGNLSVNNLNSGTSASSTTFWRGDGSWATPLNIATSNLTATGAYTLTQGSNTLTILGSNSSSAYKPLAVQTFNDGTTNGYYLVGKDHFSTERFRIMGQGTDVELQSVNNDIRLVANTDVELQAGGLASGKRAILAAQGTFSLPSVTPSPNGGDMWRNASDELMYQYAGASQNVAFRQYDFIGESLSVRTSNFTLGNTNNLTEIVDANAGAVTVTLSTTMREGIDYTVKCRRNATNTITFSAGGACTFDIDESSSLTPTSLVVGGAGTGIQAPYKVYTIRRLGNNIFIQ